MPITRNERKAITLEYNSFGKTCSAQCTEWDNGEGYDFSLDDKCISLHHDEINVILILSNLIHYD